MEHYKIKTVIIKIYLLPNSTLKLSWKISTPFTYIYKILFEVTASMTWFDECFDSIVFHKKLLNPVNFGWEDNF